MANLERTESILKCECGGFHDCDRFSHMSRSRFFHQFPSFSCETNSLERYNCKKCDFGSDLRTIFNQHIREHHRKRIDEPKNDFAVKSYICRECSFETYSALVWIKHSNSLCFKTKEHFENVTFGKDAQLHLSTEDIQWFRCDKCNYETNRRYILKRHDRMKHTLNEETSWFRCEQCAYKTKLECYLKRHIITRHKSDEEEVQWFRCDKCDFTAKRRSRVKHHKLIKHTSEEEVLWLRCEQCSYKTKMKCSLRRHMNLHKPDGEGMWFYCSNCEYRTRRKET
jgi:KRAB domain-containing zinc finger protein